MQASISLIKQYRHQRVKSCYLNLIADIVGNLVTCAFDNRFENSSLFYINFGLFPHCFDIRYNLNTNWRPMLESCPCQFFKTGKNTVFVLHQLVLFQLETSCIHTEAANGTHFYFGNVVWKGSCPNYQFLDVK